MRLRPQKQRAKPYDASDVAVLNTGLPYPGSRLLATAGTKDVIDTGDYDENLDRSACKAAWHELGFSIMCDWLHNPANYGTRPAAWWIFERCQLVPPSRLHQLVRLIELDDLCTQEDSGLRHQLSVKADGPRKAALLGILDGQPVKIIGELELSFDGLFLTGAML